MSVSGHLIVDRYRLVSQVGTGGMGVVWEGWDERLQRRVAVKQLRLPPELTDDERHLASQRAMREARITARLHHRYAVSVFDVVDDDGRPSLIMQFVPSRTLAEVLAEGGPLPPHRVARMGAEVASALSAAHELGIVHRDVKPANVLVADDGTALISDFGISRALDDISMTTTGMLHGTPAYLSPEVARGEQATFASDLFGLGATMYAAVEGAPPFGTDTNSIALLHRVAAGDFEPPRHSGPLTPLLLQLLSSEPALRPPMHSAASMLRELASNREVAQSPAIGAYSDSNELTTPLATPTTTAAVEATTEPRTEPGDDSETLAVAATEIDHETSPAYGDAPPPNPTRRHRRTALVAVLVVALAAVGIGTAFLVRQLGGRDSGIGAQPPSTSTSAASTPTTESPPSQTSTTSPSPKASPTPTPARNATTAARLRNTITSYYALMPADTDRAWNLLTDAYKASHTSSRRGYEGFWATIDRVETRDVTASPPNRAEATVIYHRKDGEVVVEKTSFQLVDEGGTMKIADSSVISSSTR